MTKNSTLDPLSMLLDAAMFIQDDKPGWAKAAREAVAHARASRPAPTREEILNAMEMHIYPAPSMNVICEIEGFGEAADAILALTRAEGSEPR